VPGKAIVSSKRVAPDNSGQTAKRVMPKGRPWQPGQSGNPSGRPRTAALSHALRQKLAEFVPDDPERRTYAQKLADSLIDKAMKGDPDTFRAIVDRVEGKPLQSFEVTHTSAVAGALQEFTRRELRAYAEGGHLPEWFVQQQRPSISAEGETSNDDDATGTK